MLLMVDAQTAKIFPYFTYTTDTVVAESLNWACRQYPVPANKPTGCLRKVKPETLLITYNTS
jgi:hypothetical protein